MNSPIRLAGAAALSAALLLAACSKSHNTSTDTSSSNSTAATTAPAPSDATTAPAPDATTAGEATLATTAPGGGTTASSSNGSGSSGYISMPVYPGAAENKDQEMSMASNGTSVVMKVYTSKDDAKAVADWYKSHLPAAWKNGVFSTDNKTVGTFSNEMTDGDQSVIVASQDDKTTRIQITTKHGK